MPERRALVLGGGGVAGIAWMTGLLAGLAEAGQDVTGADVIIGTSAGAAVAAQVGSGLPLDALFARQVGPALQAREIPGRAGHGEARRRVHRTADRRDLRAGHAAAGRRLRAGVYCFRTGHTDVELRLVSAGELGHDRDPCLSVCCT